MLVDNNDNLIKENIDITLCISWYKEANSCDEITKSVKITSFDYCSVNCDACKEHASSVRCRNMVFICVHSNASLWWMTSLMISTLRNWWRSSKPARCMCSWFYIDVWFSTWKFLGSQFDGSVLGHSYTLNVLEDCGDCFFFPFIWIRHSWCLLMPVSFDKVMQEVFGYGVCSVRISDI